MNFLEKSFIMKIFKKQYSVPNERGKTGDLFTFSIVLYKIKYFKLNYGISILFTLIP
jgi:hypothetical protein